MLAVAAPALAQGMTVQNVMDLIHAGIPQEAIAAKVRSSGSSFDLSADQMIALKNAGVSGPLLTAMVSGPAANTAPRAAQVSMDSPDPMVLHPTGVYLLVNGDTAPRMARMNATVTNQAKTGGLIGYALTSGIASMSIKAAIQNASARIQSASTRPTFYFFFDEANPATAAQGSNWLSGSAATVSSPSEFTLIHLMQKDGRREARVGSVNIGGAKTGVMDKDRIPFEYDMVRPGVYRATVSRDLDKGEYGFIYAIGGSGTAGAMNARIFDFGVS